MSLTNFSVSFKRQVKPADYESGASEVILSGAFEDGDDQQAVLDNAAQMAKAKVLELVGKAPAATPDKKTQTAASPVATPPAAVIATGAEAAPQPTPEGAKGRGRPPGAKNRPPIEAKPAPATTQADLEEMLGGPAAAPAPVSDEELIQAVRKHADVIGPEKIKAHVQEYLGKLLPLAKGEIQRVRQVKEIPQASRADFIKGLGDLK